MTPILLLICSILTQMSLSQSFRSHHGYCSEYQCPRRRIGEDFLFECMQTNVTISDFSSINSRELPLLPIILPMPILRRTLLFQQVFPLAAVVRLQQRIERLPLLGTRRKTLPTPGNLEQKPTRETKPAPCPSSLLFLPIVLPMAATAI